MPTANVADAPDPFVTYATPPIPETGTKGLPDPITKSPKIEAGTLAPAPASTTTKVVRTVAGHSQPDGGRIATGHDHRIGHFLMGDGKDSAVDLEAGIGCDDTFRRHRNPDRIAKAGPGAIIPRS